MYSRLQKAARIFTILFATAGIAAPAPQTATAPTRDQLFTELNPVFQQICNDSWSASGPAVARKGYSRDNIARFVDMLQSNHGKVARRAADYPSTSRLLRTTAGEFRFVDLDGDGQLELVVAADESGSGQLNDVYVIWRTPDTYRFRVQHLTAYHVDKLDQVIQDADGDGKMELVLPELMTSGRAGQPQVVYPAVYALASGDYVDESESFSAYYLNTVLPQVDRQIHDLINTQAPADDLLVVQLERDKLLRLTGSPMAGLFDAEWRASSPIVEQRLLAVAVFRDIALLSGNRQAVIDLNIMARDWSSAVSEDARLALRDVSVRWPVLP